MNFLTRALLKSVTHSSPRIPVWLSTYRLFLPIDYYLVAPEAQSSGDAAGGGQEVRVERVEYLLKNCDGIGETGFELRPPSPQLDLGKAARAMIRVSAKLRSQAGCHEHLAPTRCASERLRA